VAFFDHVGERWLEVTVETLFSVSMDDNGSGHAAIANLEA
jgi:hypothetical protein